MSIILSPNVRSINKSPFPKIERGSAKLSSIFSTASTGCPQAIEPTSGAIATPLGFSFGGTGQSNALVFIKLRDYAERDGFDIASLVNRANGYFFTTNRQGQIFALQPPAIQGLGTSSGFTMYLVDQTGQGQDALARLYEAGLHSGEAELPGDALPWAGKKAHTIQVEDGFASSYLSFLADRPASVLGALRNVAYADGAALVHCAAGKDRTGTTVALALMVVGADPEAVVADYAASTERMDRIIARLVGRHTYAENLAHRPVSSHDTRPESMRTFLDYARERFGGVEQMLGQIGWTPADSAQMRRKLLG